MNEANGLKVKPVQGNATLRTENISTLTRHAGPKFCESHGIICTLSASNLIHDSSSDRFDVQKIPPSSPSICVTCAGSSDAANQQRSDSGWSSDEELEHLLEAGDFRSKKDAEQCMFVLNNTCSIDEMKEDITCNAPIFEDSLNFEEFPAVESDLHNRAIETDFVSDQSVVSNASYSFSNSPVDPLSSTFPSSDSYAYLCAEDVDYCDSYFGVHRSQFLKEREKSVCHITTSKEFRTAPVGHKTSDVTTFRMSSSFLDQLPKLADDNAYSSCFLQSLSNQRNDYANSDSSTTLGAPCNDITTSDLSVSGCNPPPRTYAILEHALVSPSSSWQDACEDRSAILDICSTRHPTVGFQPHASVIQVKCKIRTCTSEAETVSSEFSEKKQRGICRSDLAWNQRFIELQQFKSIHGHCNVPQKYEKNPSLGAWVARNRLFMRQLDALGEKSRVSTVQSQRMKMLKDMGLVSCIGKGAFGRTTGHLMSSRNTREWESQFVILQKYRESHGDCDVPVKSDKYKSLGRWVSAQRKKYHQYFGLNAAGKPSNDLLVRFERLKEIGFNFCIGSGKAKRGKSM
ncbi:hypothetical protein ACHAWX_002889 [Stephanocyclus meneghinianus]